MSSSLEEDIVEVALKGFKDEIGEGQKQMSNKRIQCVTCSTNQREPWREGRGLPKLTSSLPQQLLRILELGARPVRT